MPFRHSMMTNKLTVEACMRKHGVPPSCLTLAEMYCVFDTY
jgi:hypothetical protein